MCRISHNTVPLVVGVPKTWRDRRNMASLRQHGSCLLAVCEGCERTSELSCLAASYCYLYSFIFIKPKLINITLTLCVVWLGLLEAASVAISSPVCAILVYHTIINYCTCRSHSYADIFFKAVTSPICPSCFRVTLSIPVWLWSIRIRAIHQRTTKLVDSHAHGKWIIVYRVIVYFSWINSSAIP